MKSTAFLLAALAATTINAQNLSSGYFTNGNIYRHELNPAFDCEHSYVAIPALGNINVVERGNLPLSSLLYNRNGRTVTWMNKDVTAAEFLSNIKDNNKLTEDLKLQVLGWGFKAFDGYNTVAINVRQGLTLNVPGTLLSMTKEGLTNKKYEINDLNAHVDAYAEIALGHSHQLNDQFRVGGKLKFLLGIANMDAKFNNVTLDLNQTAYTVSADAEVQSNIKSIDYKYKTNENTGKQYVNGISKIKPGVSGFGLAVDLGAEFRLDDTWDFSLAVNDLGFLSYGKTYTVKSDPNYKFTTDKYLFSADGDDSNNFSDEFDRLGDDFAQLYQLRDCGDTGGRTKMLGATINVGAEYTCPFYNKLSFGLLSTTRLQGKYTWTEGRLSANIAPWRPLSAGLNFAYGTYGASLGWIVNFHTRGFGLFLGMDHTLGKFSKQFIPLSSNKQLSFGINVLY